jgi:hypothetical protein
VFGDCLLYGQSGKRVRNICTLWHLFHICGCKIKLLWTRMLILIGVTICKRKLHWWPLTAVISLWGSYSKTQMQGDLLNVTWDFTLSTRFMLVTSCSLFLAPSPYYVRVKSYARECGKQVARTYLFNDSLTKSWLWPLSKRSL